MKRTLTHTRIPTHWVGPLYFKEMHYLDKQISDYTVSAPLATYETTLFHSVGRGAKVTRLAKTLKTTLLSDVMTRSILLEAPDAARARDVVEKIVSSIAHYQETVVKKHSRYAVLERIDPKIVGSLIYLRMTFNTGNASGHNMSTFASDLIATNILEDFADLTYLSVSGNYCVDKKVSAVNSILGRGKSMIAQITLSRDLLKDVLRTTPEAMIELNLKKNMIGSIASGGLMSANAHYANMLLAFYLATGQDAANIVEGSQGITQAELKDDQLVFSVTLPNIIVGSVGHGKDALDAAENVKTLVGDAPEGAQTLAHIAAACVLCGELSLMAALTNQHELSKSHRAIERKK